MNYKHSLSFRIRLSFILFGALLSIAIATGVYIAIEGIEDQLLKDSLVFKLKHFREQSDKQLGHITQIGPDSKIYYIADKGQKQLPPRLQNLAEGKHEIRGERDFYILVGRIDNNWVYVVTDSTQFEQREKNISLALIVSVMLSILIAFWLGRWISARVISPVSSLAQQVAQRTPGEKNTSRVATLYAQDEVGELAATFDRYIDQLEQFIQREQEFTADASHELRTPIAIITGATELLLDNSEIPDRPRRQIERIARASHRMAQTVESLLMLARENETTQHIDNESCQVRSIVTEVIDSQQSLIEQKPITLQSNIRNNFEIPVSRTFLSIVLNNLVKNAITHTQEGEISITVDQHWIEVRDTGSGIAEEDIVHVFNRHYRGKNPKIAGSGLGLSIVKRICDRHHWKISITSQADSGTCVRLTF